MSKYGGKDKDVVTKTITNNNYELLLALLPVLHTL